MAPFATNVGVLPRHHVNSPPPEQIVGQNKTHISCSGILREVFLRKVFYRFYIHIHVDLRENPWSFEQNSAKMIKYSVGEKNFPMGHNSSSQKKNTDIPDLQNASCQEGTPPPKHKKLLMKFIHCTWSCLIGRFLYQSSEDYIYAIDKCFFWGGISGSKIVFKVGISNHPSASHIQLLQSQDLLSAEGS